MIKISSCLHECFLGAKKLHGQFVVRGRENILNKSNNQLINQSSSLWRRYKFYCCKPCYFYFCLFLFYKSLGVFFAIAWSAAGTSPIARNFPRFKSCAIAGYSTKPRTITSYCWECSQVYYFNLLFNIVIILKHYYYNNIIWSCGLTNNNGPQ